MSKKPPVNTADLSLTSVPAFWPMAMAAALWEQGAELVAKNLKFVEEDIKIHDHLRPKLATPNGRHSHTRRRAARGTYGDDR
jgi:hypothetical protein